jgi:hypothetical protein
MKVRLALAAALAIPLGLSAMPTAVEYLPAKISLPQVVKLGDGSVLPAGPYDVQVHYKGFGNAAELQFFQNRVFKGRTNAEARGFPAQPPAGAALDTSGKKTSDMKFDGSSAAVKDVKGEAQESHIPKWESPAGAPAAFNWEKAGFRAGQKGVVTPGGPGMLKLSFDSANSAAGVIAILPYVEKGRK